MDDDYELAELQADRCSTIKHLIDQGMSADEAEALATEALKGPARVPIPTIAELEDERQMKIAREVIERNDELFRRLADL